MAGAEGEDASQAGASIRDNLSKTRLSLDLLAQLEETRQKSPPVQRKERRGKRSTRAERGGAFTSSATAGSGFRVIIEFNRNFPGGTSAARVVLINAWTAYAKRAGRLRPADETRLGILFATLPQASAVYPDLMRVFAAQDDIDLEKSLWTDNYLFGRLAKQSIEMLAAWHLPSTGKRSSSSGPRRPKAPEVVPLVHKIWLDQKIHRCVYESRRTVKADAAFASFAADGKDVVWAVADTGVDGRHPHFKTLDTLALPHGLIHKDFTDSYLTEQDSQNGALSDQAGHGTHVAGIIAGMTCPKSIAADTPGAVEKIRIAFQVMNNRGLTDTEIRGYGERISGLSPYCKILSLKVMKSKADGDLSSVLAAIGYIQRQNDNGRHIKIHGLNLSLGYTLNANWYAAGQSPLCAEVDRLVRCGVCVVAAAGNGGYGSVSVLGGTSEQAAHLGTISDPGNAALAITVGSTHRDMPHTYGISYFSGKGPTSDGRMKPDLVAPGERIVSCTPLDDDCVRNNIAPFCVDSGTSMAAPHVSGAIAAFLSVRAEFKGRPEDVKEIFIKATTDLKRRVEFQGGGLLDLMRALQSV